MGALDKQKTGSGGGSIDADVMEYKGTWAANTNTPTLSNSDTGVEGNTYKVSTAGSTDFGAGAISFAIGDIVINNGSIWEKIEGSAATNITNSDVDANAGISFSKLETVGTDHIVGRTASGSGVVTGLSASQVRTLLNVEDGATADQTDSEIETAYNNQVSVASQAEAEAGTVTSVRRFTPERIKQAIDALAGGGGGGGFWDGTVVLASDFSLLNDNTFNDVTGMNVSLDASSSYLFSMAIGGYYENSGDNPQCRITFDYTDTYDIGGWQDQLDGHLFTINFGSESTLINATSKRFAMFYAYIETTNAGTFKLQVRQFTASTVDTSYILKNSIIRYKKIS